MRILLSVLFAAFAFTAAAPASVPAAPQAQQRCHPSYPDYCIPPPPPDLDCPDITGRKPFRVRHDVRDADPHGFDRDKDGRACEPRPQRRS
jgi:micrococcal nuclease